MASASPSVDAISPQICSCHSHLMSPVSCSSSVYKFPSPSSDSKSVQVAISPVSSQGPICRICHEGDYKEELLAPCRCSGSMGLVHQSCIEKWLSSANLQSCEICKYSFITSKEPRPYTDWLRHPRKPSDLRNLLGDIFFFILLTPLAAISAYLCVLGAQHYAMWGMQWEASGLVALALLLLCLYCIWCWVTVRYHINVLVEWRQTHQLVKLVKMSRSPSSVYMMQPTVPSDSNNNRSGNGDVGREVVVSPAAAANRTPIASHQLAQTPRPLIRLREMRLHPWPLDGGRTRHLSEPHDRATTSITTNVFVHSILHSSHLPETVV